MTVGAPPLGFKLVLSRSGHSPRIERVGPSNVTQVGLGRGIEDLPKLAALLFPVCARAQAAAALLAGERAAGISLTKVQSAARESIVLAESLAACVWRAALTWPELLGRPGHPDLVKQARDASNDLADAIFADDWARVGGADLRFDTPQIRESLLSLQGVLKSLTGSVDEVAARSKRAVSPTLRPVDAETLVLDRALADEPREETPRSLIMSSVSGWCVSDWFLAQWQYALQILDRLRATLIQIDREPAPAAFDIEDGVGFGVVMTARGRLWHGVQLEEGRVTRWATMAPTDWNLARGGLLEQLATGVPLEADPEAQAKWAIAAVDPCAPCTTAWAEETTYA